MDAEVRQNIIDFKQTFATNEGQRVLKRLEALFAKCQVPAVIDPYNLALDLGQRSVVEYIKTKIESKLDDEENERTQ